MYPENFSPPDSPTLEQQRDALQKGLGRAFQWAGMGILDPDSLLKACLTDQRYDRECESSRGEWLWTMIAKMGMTQKFRGPILLALKSPENDRNAAQHCEIAYHFARHGDVHLRRQLHDFVSHRHFPSSLWIGESELIDLEGEAALRLIASGRGKQRESYDWDWDDDQVIQRAVDNLGEARVREILTDVTDPGMVRFAAAWKQKANLPTDDNSSRATRAVSEPLDLDTLFSPHNLTDNGYWLRGWGMRAEESSLHPILKRLWREQNPAVIAKVLRTFSNRELPQVDARLIAFANHGDAEVRRWAIRALGQNSHPLVRRLALQKLEIDRTDGAVVKLLVRNFESGDEQRLLDQVDLPLDPCDRHGLLMDLLALLETNESADSSELGLIVYFHTPCQSCRYWMARLLCRVNNAPAWLVDECRGDANEDCHTVDMPDQSDEET